MNPDAHTLWQAPLWALSVLLAALAMLGPFSIDTYIPAFAGIARSLHAGPIEIQQTLSAYLFGFAFMSLFHGALSDSLGRRPVVLVGLAVYTLASAGCALSSSIGQLIACRGVQGLSAGAGIVVSRAVVRDMFAPTDAQRVMAQITLFFGVAPAVAPLMGGLLFVHIGWQAVFWFLTLVSIALWVGNWLLLPETLHITHRQPFELGHLLRGYWQLGTSARFLLLALVSGVPFNGMFVYVLCAPTFLGQHLHLQPAQFFIFFCIIISGIMGGAWISGRLAGRVSPQHQIRNGFVIMTAMALLQLGASWLWPPQAWWTLPLIGVFSLGWAMITPVVTLLVLDLFPLRRGMAASLQAFVVSSFNGLVAGVVSPWVMHSTRALAVASASMLAMGLVAWLLVKPRLANPSIMRG